MQNARWQTIGEQQTFSMYQTLDRYLPEPSEAAKSFGFVVRAKWLGYVCLNTLSCGESDAVCMGFALGTALPLTKQ